MTFSTYVIDLLCTWFAGDRWYSGGPALAQLSVWLGMYLVMVESKHKAYRAVLSELQDACMTVEGAKESALKVLDGSYAEIRENIHTRVKIQVTERVVAEAAQLLAEYQMAID